MPARASARWHDASVKVVVTGAASRLAQAVLPALCADERVDEVLAIDASRVPADHPKLRKAFVDVTGVARDVHFSGATALVHFNFAVPAPAPAADELFDRNVRAAHKLFHAARAAGASRLIHISTASVYGSAIHANEQTPLRPIPEFTYAAHHARLEQLLAIDFPDCVRLRPHLAVGPHAHPLAKVVLKQPFHVRLGEPEPLFQCVHEADVAQAVILALDPKARGAYNLAIDESFTLRDALRARHRFALAVPPFASRAALRLAARVARCELDAGSLAAFSRTLLVNCRRAIIELGWRSRFTLPEALAAT